MDEIKELLAKLKSQRGHKEIEYLYGYEKGYHDVREEVITALEAIINNMESNELSDFLHRSWSEE